MTILLQTAAFHLFFQPLPVWDYWYTLLLPLCSGVAIVWKAIKCTSMRRVPIESLELLFWILLTMVCVAGGLAILVRGLEFLTR